MPTVTIDAGPLIELAEKITHRQRTIWFRDVERQDLAVLVPSGVATEFMRGARNRGTAEWWLAKLEGLDTSYETARRAGILLRKVGDRGISVIDAHVVQHAVELHAGILTSDPRDLERLVEASGVRVPIQRLLWPG